MISVCGLYSDYSDTLLYPCREEGGGRLGESGAPVLRLS